MNLLVRSLVFVALTGLTTVPEASQLTTLEPGPSAAERGSREAVSAADRQFIAAAAQDAMTQIQFGQLAAHKGASAQVRDLGDRMVEDHTKASDALKAIAARKGIALPADIPAAQRRQFQRLAKLSGPEFDQAYVKHVRMLQLREVSAFRSAARSARDPEMKAFAQATLPDVEEQLVLVVFAAAMTLA